MARITQDIPKAEPPQYGGSSRGIDTPRPNRAMETLFSGLGDLLGGVATMGENIIESRIQNDINQGADDIRGEFGVDAGMEITGENARNSPTNTLATPTEITRRGDSIAKLKQLVEEGRINDTHYSARLNSMMKNLRAKYPGHREKVDQLIEREVGFNPANRLRSEMQSTIDKAAAQRNSAAEKYETWLNSESVRGRLPVDFNERKAAGNPYTQSEVEDYVRTKQREEIEFKDDAARINRDIAQNTLSERQLEETASKHANRLINETIRDVGGTVLGEQLKKFEQQITKIQAGGLKASPQEIEGLKAGLAQIKVQLTTALHNRMNVQTDWGSKLGPEKTKKIIDGALLPYNILEDALTNDKMGIIPSAMNMIKAQKDADTRRLMENNEGLRKLSVVQDQLGQTGIAIMQMSPGGPQMLSEAGKAVVDLKLSDMIIDGKPAKQATEEIKRDLGSKASATAYRTLVNKAIDLTLAEDTKKEGAAALSSALFSRENDNFAQMFSSKDRLDVWTRMVSPEMTKRMESLKEVDPGAWSRYKEWSIKNVYPIFKGEIDEVNKIVGKDRHFTVNFDGKQLVVQPTPEGMALGRSTIEPRLRHLQAGTDRLNRALYNLEPILKAEGGSIEKELPGMLQNMQVDLQQEKKPTDYIDLIFQGLKGAGKFLSDTEVIKMPEESGRSIFDMYQFEQMSPAAREKRSDVEQSNIRLAGTSMDDIAPLKEVIGKAESDAAGGYEAVFNGWPAELKPERLTAMSVKDVSALQNKAVKAGAESSAAGKYQFIRATFDRLVDKLGIDKSTPFNEETQDAMAFELVKEAGLAKFQAGELPKEKFMNNLAAIWAGLPMTSGKSAHAGTGSIKATVAPKEVMKALEQLVPGKTSDLGEKFRNVSTEYTSGKGTTNVDLKSFAEENKGGSDLEQFGGPADKGKDQGRLKKLIDSLTAEDRDALLNALMAENPANRRGDPLLPPAGVIPKESGGSKLRRGELSRHPGIKGMTDDEDEFKKKN
jgi:muramidase (phage lysozyme)